MPTTSELTPLYGWNEEVARYYNLTTGRFVSPIAVRDALEFNIVAAQDQMRFLTQQLNAHAITTEQWQLEMMQEIKIAHTSAAASARGGWAQMTPGDWGAVGREIRTQYDYLRNFANEITSGKQLLNGTALVRADLYGQAARGTFEEMRRRMMRLLYGMTEEIRRLGHADHCEDCIKFSGHWAAIGTLPRIGESVCITNCHCRFDYRRPNGKGGWIYDTATN